MSTEQNTVKQASADEQGSTKNLSNLPPEFVNRFIGETYRFVTQLHLELTTLTTLMLEKNIITTEELDATFKKVKENFDKGVAKQREKEQGQGGMPNQQHQHRPEETGEGALDIGKSPILHSDSRKAPTGHGG